jgi:hypothetical protein
MGAQDAVGFHLACEAGSRAASGGYRFGDGGLELIVGRDYCHTRKHITGWLRMSRRSSNSSFICFRNGFPIFPFVLRFNLFSEVSVAG